MVYDQNLFSKLSVRYLGKPAQSAPSANGEKDQQDTGCTFGAEGAPGPEDPDAESHSAQSAQKVHPESGRNQDQSALGAEGADFPGVRPGNDENEDDEEGIPF